MVRGWLGQVLSANPARLWQSNCVKETAELLHEVFPDDLKFSNPKFLSWLYSSSPSGEVIESNVDDEQGRIGHYAVVPQRWHYQGGSILVALSLNTAVSERARGLGLFTRLAAETYEAAASKNVRFVVGVANANSTPGFVRKLGFTLLESLDSRVVAGFAVRRPRELDIHNEAEVRSFLDENAAAISAESFERVWDYAEFSWRVDNPAASYRMHVIENCLVVSCRTKQFGLPVSVILKVFVGREARQPDLFRIGVALNRAMRTVVSVYGGHNNRVRTRGLRIPARFRPSPLNLIVRNLDTDSTVTPRPTVMEFLDFDAY
jgi:hypothetical protein